MMVENIIKIKNLLEEYSKDEVQNLPEFYLDFSLCNFEQGFGGN